MERTPLLSFGYHRFNLTVGVALFRSLFLLLCCCITATWSYGQTKTDLRISSGIEKTYRKAFLVDEDQIRRIAAEFEKAGKVLKVPTAVVFRVVRKDERFYETTRVDDVVSDANIPGREITELRIELRIIDPGKVRDPWESAFYAVAMFQSKSELKAQLVVRHEDRTWSLTTADAIEGQMERTFHAKSVSYWLLVAFAFSALLLLFRLFPKDGVASEFLSFLKVPLWFLFCFLAVLTYFGSERWEWYARYFGPESGFAWGEYRKLLADREALRGSVFWVFLVGIPVSIVANLVTFFLTRDK